MGAYLNNHEILVGYGGENKDRRKLKNRKMGKLGWGDSSVGRVIALQAQGPGFEHQHHKK